MCTAEINGKTGWEVHGQTGEGEAGRERAGEDPIEKDKRSKSTEKWEEERKTWQKRPACRKEKEDKWRRSCESDQWKEWNRKEKGERRSIPDIQKEKHEIEEITKIKQITKIKEITNEGETEKIEANETVDWEKKLEEREAIIAEKEIEKSGRKKEKEDEKMSFKLLQLCKELVEAEGTKWEKSKERRLEEKRIEQERNERIKDCERKGKWKVRQTS